MKARLSAVLAAMLVLVVASGVAVAGTRATAPTPVVIKIVAKKGRPVGGVARPTVKKGKLVRIVVRTDAGREVHLHGYDIERKVVPGQPTVLQFRAKITGRFEFELHRPNVLLAVLTVR
jgi:hypothetical protein